MIVLGTTVVTNTMLEYSGAHTGLIATKGFRDIIELRRGYRESLFDIRLEAPYQIVPRQRRLGVKERIDYAGRVVVPLDEEDVRNAVLAPERTRREVDCGVPALFIRKSGS